MGGIRGGSSFATRGSSTHRILGDGAAMYELVSQVSTIPERSGCNNSRLIKSHLSDLPSFFCQCSLFHV